ncbi:MAG: hypothetical protein ACNA8R_01800 [Nitriliruptoraceae bacterium]
MKPIGWFLLLVGVAIAVLWALLLGTGQVPEVDEGRLDIWFHVVAELAAAGLLIAAGVTLLRSSRVGRPLAAVAVGALGYTTVNSAGYYAESGDRAMVAMFAVLTVATVAVAAALVRHGGRAAAVDATPAPSDVPTSSAAAR